jgi:tRNA threonylcarbamoyl adenosine modification protein (Sua5/YciO/YrdC/YwlC family)
VESAAALALGEIVVLPAEGLYGYHVRPDRPEALRRLHAVKPREAGRGWILLVDDPGALDHWTPPPHAALRALAARHWPGALTLVAPAPDSIPSALRASDGTVAVRCPGNAFLRDVVRASGGALLTTSANRPGEPAPARIEDAALAGVALAVDAGTLSGRPSTLATVDGSTVRVLREGSVVLADIGGDET